MAEWEKNMDSKVNKTGEQPYTCPSILPFTSLPPKNEANNNSFYRSVMKAKKNDGFFFKKNNFFEYFFHSIVEKNKLSEPHSFSFLIYLALGVKNIIC